MAKRTLEQIRKAPAYVVAEAAHYLGLPKSTLRVWCVGQTNRLPSGRTAFFKPLIEPAQKAPPVLSFANLERGPLKHCASSQAA
jgi:hypothetical protein